MKYLIVLIALCPMMCDICKYSENPLGWGMIGNKPWCTLNNECQSVECLYDTEAECKRSAFVDGELGMKEKEWCEPKKDVEYKDPE